MIQQSHSWVYTWKKTKILIQKDICTPMFYSSTIYNSQDMKITQVHINRQLA